MLTRSGLVHIVLEVLLYRELGLLLSRSSTLTSLRPGLPVRLLLSWQNLVIGSVFTLTIGLPPPIFGDRVVLRVLLCLRRHVSSGRKLSTETWCSSLHIGFQPNQMFWQISCRGTTWTIGSSVWTEASSPPWWSTSPSTPVWMLSPPIGRPSSLVTCLGTGTVRQWHRMPF